MSAEDLHQYYRKINVEVDELEDACNWSCEMCPRLKEVYNPKFECDGGDCIRSFIRAGYRLSDEVIADLEEQHEEYIREYGEL